MHHDDGCMAIDEVERLQARLTALEQERKHLLAVIEILQDIGGSLHFADIVQSVDPAPGRDVRARPLLDLPGRARRRQRPAGGELRGSGHPELRGGPGPLPRAPARARRPARRCSSPTPPPTRRWARRAGRWRRARSRPSPSSRSRGGARAIGAIFLRTFRDGPSFSAADLQFCQVVANLTAKALRNAHRFERLRQAEGRGRGRPPAGAGAGRAHRLHAPAAGRRTRPRLGRRARRWPTACRPRSSGWWGWRRRC